MSKGRVVKGIEQTWCRTNKSARGDGKFAATMQQLISSTPVLGIALQPLYFTYLAITSWLYGLLAVYRAAVAVVVQVVVTAAAMS